MTSLPGAECGIGVELFDMCYRVRLDHSHFTVLEHLFQDIYEKYMLDTVACPFFKIKSSGLLGKRRLFPRRGVPVASRGEWSYVATSWGE